MHMLIRALVSADAPDAAVETARCDVFQPLVDRRTFDYYTTFDEDGDGVSGRDRWGDYPPAARLTTPAGRELLEDGWDATVAAYEAGFDRVETFLETSEPVDYWTDLGTFWHYQDAFTAIAEAEGPHTYLYDQGGFGIRHESQLPAVDANANCYHETTETAHPDGDLYVVPADVHY